VYRAEEGAEISKRGGEVGSPRQRGVHALGAPEIFEDQHALPGVEVDHLRTDRARLERPRSLVVAGLEDDSLRGGLVLGESLELWSGLFHHDGAGRLAEAHPPDPIDVSISGRLDMDLSPRRDEPKLLQVSR
jgi:hypothetical protein